MYHGNNNVADQGQEIGSGMRLTQLSPLNHPTSSYVMNITVGTSNCIPRLVRASETEFVGPEIDVKYRRLEFASCLVLPLKCPLDTDRTDFPRDHGLPS